MSQFIEMFGDNVSKKKISDVCDVRGGSTPTRTTKEFWNNGTISWFTIEDIYEQGRYISETKQHITELATKKCFVYPVDTVLICCTASVGEYAITKKEMASNQQFNGMMIKDKSELHPEYLLYVASTLKEDLLRQARKTTINFVSRSKLENIEIPVPPYSEQLGFVSVYRQADKSGFDELKSQFIEMFGDNVSKKKISDVCDVRGGSTPTRTTKEFWNNGTISWFTIEDIYEQGRYISETKQHITELATKKCFVYPVDTVLICCTASVGEYAITKKEMASNQQFNGMMIKDKSELHPEYLLYVASTLKEDLLRQARKTTINFVSRSKLENIEIPVPPYSEQLGFVSVYRQADKSGSVLQYMIAC